MNNKALQTIRKYRMLSDGDRVLVGLSGGADSCALLRFLLSIREAFHLDIYACHVNHGLRGEESDNDEAFARRLCEEWGVRLFVLRTDVAAMAAEKKIGTELCGRQLRYDFFECKAKELDTKIATAHTASDNLETVLFDLTRGTGLSGLCGIPPVRGRIIRPLIEVTREEVEAYCRQQGLSYVTDSTNLSREYTRNLLRLDAVPVLRAINPAVEAGVAGFSDRMREVQAFLRSSARKLLREAGTGEGYRAERLQQADPAVRHEAFRILCGELAIIPEAKHIALLDHIVYNGGAAELRHYIYARRQNGLFLIERRTPAEAPPPVGPIPLEPGRTLIIQNKKLSTDLMNLEEFYNRQKNEKFLFHNGLDYDTITVTPQFRTRLPGDRFSPPGRNCTKTVKKLMNELHLPQQQRSEILLLTEGNTVLWMEGIGASRQHCVRETTLRVLVIRTQTYNS